MKITMFVAALAAMILSQAGASAADKTPAILKSVKAKQTLSKGQMKKVKGEYINPYLYAGYYGKYNLGYYGLGLYGLGYNKYNLGVYGLGYNKYNLGYYGLGYNGLGYNGYNGYCNTPYLGFYGWR